MQPTLQTTRSSTRRRGRAIAAGAVLIALMVLAAATLAPTPAYAAGDLFRLNADVTVGPGETFGSVVVMNGTIVVDGRVNNDVFAANGDIIVHDGGSIGGDAVSLTGKVTTEGTGTVGGDQIEVRSGAVGAGGPSAQAVVGDFDGVGAGIAGWIALTLGALGVGLLLVLISGGSLRTVGREISERTGRTVLVGFLALIGVPVVFVVLLISVIGIPVALLLILLVPLFSLYGMFALALVVGERLLVMFDRPQAKDVWAMVAGVLLISLIRLIPVLGWIAFAVAALAGFGASVSYLWDYFQGRRAARPGPGQALPPYPMDPYPVGPHPPAGPDPAGPYPAGPYPAGPYPAGPYAPAGYPAAYPPAGHPGTYPASGYPAAYPPPGYPAAYPETPDPIAEATSTEPEATPAEPEATPAEPEATPAEPPVPAVPAVLAVPEATIVPEATPAPGKQAPEPRFHI